MRLFEEAAGSVSSSDAGEAERFFLRALPIFCLVKLSTIREIESIMLNIRARKGWKT